MQDAQNNRVIVVGGGIAGIVTALELLEHGQPVILLERGTRERFGGLANEAFGGMLFAGTDLQRRNGIADSAELLRADWYRAAEFAEDDHWPMRWADTYIQRSTSDVYQWLRSHGIGFVPAVQWVERGEFTALNTLPRYHVIWGTGWHLTQTLIKALLEHPRRGLLELRFGHRVEQFIQQQDSICGVQGEADGQPFALHGRAVVVASGGINGNLQRVRQVWDRARYGEPPQLLLNGSHPEADGHLHDQVAELGGRVLRLGQMWNYAAGIRHPQPRFADQGLSLIPPRSALWLDCRGRRVGPHPMMSGFDTHQLCGRLGRLEDQYGWLLLNRRILLKEMAISGSEVNHAFRERDSLRLIREMLFGNRAQARLLLEQCPDVLSADSYEALAQQMNALVGNHKVSAGHLRASVEPYDAMIARGPRFHNDAQLRRLHQLRNWRGDRLRLLKNQPINDPKALPLVAIRVMLLSRKSMGGIETDLQSRVLDAAGQPIPGLYAVGEACGFGGGGISGIRSLEGTFLSGCILTARIAGQALAGISASSPTLPQGPQQ